MQRSLNESQELQRRSAEALQLDSMMDECFCSAWTQTLAVTSSVQEAFQDEACLYLRSRALHHLRFNVGVENKAGLLFVKVSSSQGRLRLHPARTRASFSS